MRVVVHGLLGSEEVTRECEWEEVQALMQDIQDHRPDWRAITVVHIEDFPRLMEGAVKLSDTPNILSTGTHSAGPSTKMDPSKLPHRMS